MSDGLERAHEKRKRIAERHKRLEEEGMETSFLTSLSHRKSPYRRSMKQSTSAR